MMTDYMLTVIRADKLARDVRVNGVDSIHDAIELAERHTGCRVDHGRAGIGSEFDPAVIIENGTAYVLHDKDATVSMQIVNHAKEKGVVLPRGKA